MEFCFLLMAWKSMLEVYSVEECLLAVKSDSCGQIGSHTSSIRAQVGTSLR